MDDRTFDTLTRWLSQRWHRRAAALAVASLAAPWRDVLTETVKGKKGGRKKSTLCLDGEAIQAAGKKKKKLLKQGATPGACPSPPPPPPASPPPSACTPQCVAKACGGSDGCGGTCACTSGALCHEGVCRDCTVVCRGTDVACGAALSQALLDGGTIYACPGRYVGNFTIGVNNVTLIGAGSGTDPVTSTILDARDNGRVLTIQDEITRVTLIGLRLTGGNLGETAPGGAIRAVAADVQVKACAIERNIALYGGGIYLAGRLRLTNSSVSHNDASNGGGLYLDSCDPSFITDSVIAENSATMGIGGGLLSGYMKLTVVGTEITKNEASSGGGGIANYAGDLILDAACHIHDNTSGAPGGGGIYNNGTVQLNGATVSGNTPDQCKDC